MNTLWGFLTLSSFQDMCITLLVVAVACWIVSLILKARADVPPEAIGAVFEPFFSTKPNGMGMGLPISRTIIEAHEGRIWAENNATRGATFYFTLTTAAGGAV